MSREPTVGSLGCVLEGRQSTVHCHKRLYHGLAVWEPIMLVQTEVLTAASHWWDQP